MPYQSAWFSSWIQLLTPAFCQCKSLVSSADGWSNCILHTHIENLDWIPRSCFSPGPALVISDISGMNEWIRAFMQYLFLFPQPPSLSILYLLSFSNEYTLFSFLFLTRYIVLMIIAKYRDDTFLNIIQNSDHLTIAIQSLSICIYYPKEIDPQRKAIQYNKRKTKFYTKQKKNI